MNVVEGLTKVVCRFTLTYLSSTATVLGCYVVVKSFKETYGDVVLAWHCAMAYARATFVF